MSIKKPTYLSPGGIDSGVQLTESGRSQSLAQTVSLLLFFLMLQPACLSVLLLKALLDKARAEEPPFHTLLAGNLT